MEKKAGAGATEEAAQEKARQQSRDSVVRRNSAAYLDRARAIAGMPDASEPRVLGDAVLNRVAQLMAGIMASGGAKAGAASGAAGFRTSKAELESVNIIQKYVKVARDLSAMQRDMQMDVVSLFREAAERMSPKDRDEFTALLESKMMRYEMQARVEQVANHAGMVAAHAKSRGRARGTAPPSADPPSATPPSTPPAPSDEDPWPAAEQPPPPPGSPFFTAGAADSGGADPGGAEE